VVLHLGGRGWIARQFASALDALAAHLEYDHGPTPSPEAARRADARPTTSATESTALLRASNLSKESQPPALPVPKAATSNPQNPGSSP
jgi:hypothetical protein